MLTKILSHPSSKYPCWRVPDDTHWPEDNATSVFIPVPPTSGQEITHFVPGRVLASGAFGSVFYFERLGRPYVAKFFRAYDKVPAFALAESEAKNLNILENLDLPAPRFQYMFCSTDRSKVGIVSTYVGPSQSVVGRSTDLFNQKFALVRALTLASKITSFNLALAKMGYLYFDNATENYGLDANPEDLRVSLLDPGGLLPQNQLGHQKTLQINPVTAPPEMAGMDGRFTTISGYQADYAPNATVATLGLLTLDLIIATNPGSQIADRVQQHFRSFQTEFMAELGAENPFFLTLESSISKGELKYAEDLINRCLKDPRSASDDPNFIKHLSRLINFAFKRMVGPGYCFIVNPTQSFYQSVLSEFLGLFEIQRLDGTDMLTQEKTAWQHCKTLIIESVAPYLSRLSLSEFDQRLKAIISHFPGTSDFSVNLPHPSTTAFPAVQRVGSSA